MKNYTITIKIKLTKLFLRMMIALDVFPKLALRQKSLLLSIHSPNSLPHLNDMSELDYKNHQFFRFSQVNTELLGEGFETNCLEYDLDYKFANFNMRSDCITSCVRNLYEQTQEQGYCKFSNYPLRNELLEQEENYKKCDSETDFYFDVTEVHTEHEQKCFKKCRMDCEFRYYLLQQKEVIINYPEIGIDLSF